MFNLFFDLWIAANNSSFDIVLLVGERIRLMGVLLPDEVWTGVLLPELGIEEEEELLLAVSARRSATVGILRPVGVDDLKLLPYPCPIGEIGLYFNASALGDFVTGSRTGEDAKNRYPSAVSPNGVANLGEEKPENRHIYRDSFFLSFDRFNLIRMTSIETRNEFEAYVQMDKDRNIKICEEI